MSIAVPPLKLDWLAAFVAFADSGSFTDAARTLHLSQPAVHVQVRKLGEALGVTLYRRDGRQLTLTPDGERTAAFGREVLGRCADFASGLAAGSPDTPVVLATGRGLLLHLIGPAIRKALSAGCPLRLRTRPAEGAVDDLRSGRAHLAVTHLPAVPDDLEALPLRDVGQILVLPRDHPLARRRKPPTLVDVGALPLVLPPADRPHRQNVARALADAGAPCRVAVEAEGWELMLHLTALGLGATIVNDYCALPRGLVARPLTQLPRLTVSRVTRRGAWRPPALPLLERALERLD